MTNEKSAVSNVRMTVTSSTLVAPGLRNETSKEGIWALGTVSVVVSFLVLPFGPASNQAALAVLLLAILGAAIKSSGLSSPLVVIPFTIAVWWAVLFLNPNVLNIERSFVGYRGSIVFMFGIILGSLWIRGRRNALMTVWICLLASCTASIIIFFLLPGYESGISRGAGEYTAELFGQRRLQGFFAGPFHISLAGTFLVLSSLRAKNLIPSFALRMFALSIGLCCIYFSQVRTGIVALLIGILAILLVNPSAKVRLATAYFAAFITTTLLLFSSIRNEIFGAFPALQSLTEADTDARLLNRGDTWQEAVRMILDSPIFGWGPGSAGATLQRFFPPGGHVTSHNLLLKYGVEGGIFGMLLVMALFVVLAVKLHKSGDTTRMGLAALVPLLVFGAVGSTLDTLPVSFGLAVVLGICASGQSDDCQSKVNGASQTRSKIGHRR